MLANRAVVVGGGERAQSGERTFDATGARDGLASELGSGTKCTVL